MELGTSTVIPFASDDALAKAVAAAWFEQVTAAYRAGKTQCVALSGGRIARKLFSAIVEAAEGSNDAFDRTHFFWADERCVPPNDPESNFQIAREVLFLPLKISADQIHRIRGEDRPEKAAKAAEAELRCHAGVDAAGRPVLDLILLGLGEDGHVASLFPGHPEDAATDKIAYRAIKNSPKPPPDRVTLTYSAVAAATEVWVLASGSGKEQAFKESLAKGGKTPLARVLALRERTRVFSDIRT